MTGRVEAIYLISESEGNPCLTDRVFAMAGKGLKGDRYAQSKGTFSSWPGKGRDLTLIDHALTQQLELPNGLSRRNIETSGINLRDLVGHYFKIGEVLVYGARPCEPCKHLAAILGRPEIIKELSNRDGLRADILSTGEIQAGEPIESIGRELNVYLDDESPTPEGWFGVKWPDQAIELLASGCVNSISLDHDLGDDERGTGYDVVIWIERQMFEGGFQAPYMQVHSANSSARAKMEAGIEAISRRARREF